MSTIMTGGPRMGGEARHLRELQGIMIHFFHALGQGRTDTAKQVYLTAEAVARLTEVFGDVLVRATDNEQLDALLGDWRELVEQSATDLVQASFPLDDRHLAPREITASTVDSFVRRHFSGKFPEAP